MSDDWFDRYPGLQDNGSAVQFFGDEMHAGPMLGFPGIQNPLVGMQPPMLRQERGVDVEHASVKALDDARRKNPHEPGERDQGGRTSTTSSTT